METLQSAARGLSKQVSLMYNDVVNLLGFIFLKNHLSMLRVKLRNPIECTICIFSCMAFHVIEVGGVKLARSCFQLSAGDVRLLAQSDINQTVLRKLDTIVLSCMQIEIVMVFFTCSNELAAALAFGSVVFQALRCNCRHI